MDKKLRNEIVRLIRDNIDRCTIVNSSIKWYQFSLWKYRKYELPRMGLKDAIELAEKILRLVK